MLHRAQIPIQWTAEVYNMANINISQILMKRGNTAAASNYTGPLGELLVDTGLQTIRIQDGVTAGGWVLGQGGGTDLSGINANISILSANAGVQQSQINSLRANITAANLAIISTNSVITTANTGMKSYVDAQLSTKATTAYVTTSIATANTAMKGYVDAQVATKTTASYVNTSISTAINNLINSAPGTLDTLGEIAANLANQDSAVGSIVSSITGLQSNATTQQTQIDSLLANVGVVNTGNLAFVDNAMYSSSGVIVENADLSNPATAAVILPANGSSDTLQVNNDGQVSISASGKYWTFNTDGTLVLPNGSALDFGSSHKFSTKQSLTTSIDLRDHTNRGFYTDATGVKIQSNNYSWTFGIDGKLTVPDRILTPYGVLRESTLDSGLSIDSLQGITITSNGLANKWYFNTNGTLVVPPSNTAAIESLDGYNLRIRANSASDSASARIENYNGSATTTAIGANANNATITVGEHNWTFDADGQIATPQGGRIGDTYNDGQGIGLSAGNGEGDYAVINSHTGAQYVEANETAVYIGTNYPDTNTLWTFNRDGSLQFPDSTVQITAWTGNVDSVDTHINFSASAVGHNPGNGTITFADGTLQNTAWTDVAAQDFPPNRGIWYNTNDGRTYLKYNDAWVDANPTVAPLQSYYTGNLTVTDQTIYSGDAGYTFDTDGVFTTPAGRIGTFGGPDFVMVANVDLNQQMVGMLIGNATSPTQGAFTLTQYNAYLNVTNLDTSESYNWQFDNTGNLTLPVGGNINYANGQSILSGISTTTATRWDAIPAEAGCPIYAELTPDHFYAYTQKTHLELDNTGDWYVGSGWNGSFVNGIGYDVNVTSFNGNVTVQSGINQWNFGVDGNLTVPGAIQSATGTLTLSSNTAEPALAWTISNDMFGPGSSALMAPMSDSHHIGALVFQGNTGVGEIAWVGPSGTPLDNSLVVGGSGNVIIASDYTTLWKFGTDGTFTAPGNVYVTGNLIIQGNTYQEDRELFVSAAGEAIEFANGGNIFAPAGLGNVVVSTNNSEYNWTFGTDGEMYLPTGGRLGVAGKGWTGLDGGYGYPLSLTSYYSSEMYSSCITLLPSGSLGISTYGDGTGLTNTWNFNADGINFLDNSIQATAWTGAVANIGNVAPTTVTAVSGAAWYNTDDGRTYIKYGNYWVDANPTVAPLASYYLGNLTVDNDTIDFPNGTLKVDTTGTSVLGNIIITYDSPYWVIGTSNDGGQTSYGPQGMRINPGIESNADIQLPNDADAATTSVRISNYNNTGNVEIQAHSSVWKFGFDGNLTLPTTGNINYANGQSILSGITAGSTYSNVNVAAYIADSITTGNVLGNGTDPNVYIETVSSGNTSVWTFGTDGILTLPANTAIIQGAGTDSNVTVIASDGTTTAQWTFEKTGNVIFPDATVQTTAWTNVNSVVNSTKTTTGSGDIAYPTALDLTKTVNKLSDNTGSYYTLADGVEGQTMYLVRQRTVTDPTFNSIHVTVANAYYGINTLTDQNLYFGSGQDLITLIFTDGAWQQSGGTWD